MILEDSLKIILLVGLVCTAGIRPSHAAKNCIKSDMNGRNAHSVACGDDEDTCFVGGISLPDQGCKAEADCPLNGKEVNCEQQGGGLSTTTRCCCKEDDCNSRKPGGNAHAELCKQKDPKLLMEECPTSLACASSKDVTQKCDSPDDVCFVAALPKGRFLVPDDVQNKVDAGVADVSQDADDFIKNGKVGERGCKPKADCPIDDGKEFRCTDQLCCCNTFRCNDPEKDRFKKDFCPAGKFAEKCGGGGGGSSGATGLFQHYGGAPLAGLVAGSSSVYYFLKPF